MDGDDSAELREQGRLAELLVGAMRGARPREHKKTAHRWVLLKGTAEPSCKGPNAWWFVKTWWVCPCGAAKYQTAMAEEGD